LALARPSREAGGRYRDLDARYAGEPGVLSATQQSGRGCWLSFGACRRRDLSGHRRRDRCGHRPACGQR
jgi:hypothetical protein